MTLTFEWNNRNGQNGLYIVQDDFSCRLILTLTYDGEEEWTICDQKGPRLSIKAKSFDDAKKQAETLVHNTFTLD